MTPVIIPVLGESISSGILSAWRVKDGDSVKVGQPLYELETDKITSEGTAEVAGKILLKVSEGDEVAIGATVAEIDESVKASASASTEKPVAATTSSAKAVAVDKVVEASPAVRRIAVENAIDPATVSGTGKGGRVTKGDMLAASAEKVAEPVKKEAAPVVGNPIQATTPAVSLTSSPRTSRKKMTTLRKRIAERLVNAQQTAAMLTTFNECDMSAIMATRAKYQDAFVKKHNVKLGFMSFFVKAVVKALKEVPGLNSQIDGDFIVENHFYDVGVAVGTEKGLIVPVLRDCDQKGFAVIEKDILDYAKKARDGKIQIADLQGGSFTISNGGVYGSMLSTPILNAPQSGILGMHNIIQRPIAVNDQVVIRPMMYLALSYDHRIVDGKEAVTFLVKIKESIEAPDRLLFDV